jgi:hypothetical protein
MTATSFVFTLLVCSAFVHAVISVNAEARMQVNVVAFTARMFHDPASKSRREYGKPGAGRPWADPPAGPAARSLQNFVFIGLVLCSPVL